MAALFVKSKAKESALYDLYDRRTRMAKEEYRDSVEGTPYSTQMVNYRNNLFNPLALKPTTITGVYDIDPGSTHGKALDRFIRVMDDIQKATGHLTYILNFTESRQEFNKIVYGETYITNNVERYAEVEQFIKDNPERISFFKRMRLLGEMV